MKKMLAVLLCLMLSFVFVPTAVMNPDGSGYDPMSDVNRDKTVDAYDLNRLGRAYGSTQTIPAQSGKTTIYVYQLETDPPQIENARVAVIDPSSESPGYQVTHIEYTNSLGLADFSLTPEKNYTIIAWSEKTYNYANFTTDEFGEASIAIQMGYPHLPLDWVTVTFLNRTSGALSSLYSGEIEFHVDELIYISWNQVEMRHMGMGYFTGAFLGIFNIGPWLLNEPHVPGKSYNLVVYSGVGDLLATAVYTPDGSRNANVVTFV